jgi:hypothetical protein
LCCVSQFEVYRVRLFDLTIRRYANEGCVAFVAHTAGKPGSLMRAGRRGPPAHLR